MGRNVSFDINKFERAIFSFTGKDEKLLLVKMPEKRVFDRMNDIKKAQSSEDFEELNETFNGLLADILSNNKQGKEVTAEHIRDNYDFEEKAEILNQYVKFVSGVKSDPN